MSINPAYKTQLETLTQQLRESHAVLATRRSRINDRNTSPELIAYLDGVHQLLTTLVQANQAMTVALQQDSGQRYQPEDYQY